MAGVCSPVPGRCPHRLWIGNRHSERSEESSNIGTAINNEIDSLNIITCGNDNVYNDEINVGFE
jgi:hypothetical protein